MGVTGAPLKILHPLLYEMSEQSAQPALIHGALVPTVLPPTFRIASWHALKGPGQTWRLLLGLLNCGTLRVKHQILAWIPTFWQMRRWVPCTRRWLKATAPSPPCSTTASALFTARDASGEGQNDPIQKYKASCHLKGLEALGNIYPGSPGY